MVRGESKTAVGRALTSVIWGIAAAADMALWVEYAKSKLNWADPPSRNCSHLGGLSSKTGSENLGIPK